MAEKTTAFTGPVVVGLNDKKGEIRLTDGKNVNEAKYLSIAAPATITSDTTLTFPNGTGNPGQILSTDGSGNLSWVNDSAGNPAGTNGQVQINDGGTFGAVSEGTSGQVLTSNGAGVAPTFQGAPAPATIDIDTTNVFISDNPAPSKTTAINNTGIGVNSLASITNAAENVAIGHGAVQNKSTTGSGAVTAVGYLALNSTLTGGSNTAVGRRCMQANTTGTGNTAMGDRALFTNNANSNTAIGNEALRANSSGQQNTAVGDLAYSQGNSGSGSAGVGYRALYNNTGNFNTGMGTEALFSTTSGFENTAVGHNAGNNVQGNRNTFLGKSAGYNLNSGTNNTIIGRFATSSAATVSNEITLGDSAIATLRCNQTSITALSDARDKKDIEDANIGLDFINDLRPVKFVWDTRDGARKDIKEVGFIAQELDEVQQKHGVEDHLQLVLKNNPDKLEAAPGKLIPILVQAIKDLKKELDELKKA